MFVSSSSDMICTRNITTVYAWNVTLENRKIDKFITGGPPDFFPAVYVLTILC